MAVIPAITGVRMSGAAHRAELPLLVLGPAAGTSAIALWTDCAQHLKDRFDALAWDLPGHGYNRAAHDGPFTVADLAAGVLAMVAEVQEQRGDDGTPFAYAGVALGGEVGRHLLLDHPDRVTGVLDDTADLAPAEHPEDVARLLREHFLGDVAGDGDRPGLDGRSRSLVALTSVVVGGRHDELVPHLREARHHGLSWEEIDEVLQQTAIYCGVPAASTAVQIAQRVRDEEEKP